MGQRTHGVGILGEYRFQDLQVLFHKVSHGILVFLLFQSYVKELKLLELLQNGVVLLFRIQLSYIRSQNKLTVIIFIRVCYFTQFWRFLWLNKLYLYLGLDCIYVLWLVPEWNLRQHSMFHLSFLYRSLSLRFHLLILNFFEFFLQHLPVSPLHLHCLYLFNIQQYFL